MAKPRFRLSGEGHEVAVAYWCTLLGATTHDQNTDIATFTVIRQSLFDDFAAIGNGHMFLNICFSVTNVLLLLFSIVVCRESRTQDLRPLETSVARCFYLHLFGMLSLVVLYFSREAKRK